MVSRAGRGVEEAVKPRSNYYVFISVLFVTLQRLDFGVASKCGCTGPLPINQP